MAESPKTKAGLCGTTCFSTKDWIHAGSQVSTIVTDGQTGIYQIVCTIFQLV